MTTDHEKCPPPDRGEANFASVLIALFICIAAYNIATVIWGGCP